jgi:hypothetical protein
LIIVISALLLSVPETARVNSALWVPAILVINLQITTFFFVAGLMLLGANYAAVSAWLRRDLFFAYRPIR